MILSESPKMAKDFRKCEMGLWTGDTGLLNSKECSFLGAAGQVVKDTIGSAGSSLLQGVSSIEKKIIGNLKPITDGVTNPLNSVLNPLGLGTQTNTKSTTKPKRTTTKRPANDLLGNFGGLLG